MKKWWRTVFWAALSLIALRVYSTDVRVGKFESIRGLAPDLRRQYTFEHNLFTCLSGGKPISASRVNDDYCDCIDGSDEPGKQRLLPASVLQRLSTGKVRARPASDEHFKIYNILTSNMN